MYSGYFFKPFKRSITFAKSVFEQSPVYIDLYCSCNVSPLIVIKCGFELNDINWFGAYVECVAIAWHTDIALTPISFAFVKSGPPQPQPSYIEPEVSNTHIASNSTPIVSFSTIFLAIISFASFADFVAVLYAS